MNSNKEKQLTLFTPLDPIKVDRLVYELESMIYTYKHQALHTEISIGRTKPFLNCLQIVDALAKLAALIARDSPKYKYVGLEGWQRKAVYEPYYAALEPRSPLGLYELASDNKSRSKVKQIRFKTILDYFGEDAKRLFDSFEKSNDKILYYLKTEYAVSQF